MTHDRLAPLSKILRRRSSSTAPKTPPPPAARPWALAAQIPRARLETVSGMGHGLFSPGLPRRVGQIILGQTHSPAPGT